MELNYKKIPHDDFFLFDFGKTHNSRQSRGICAIPLPLGKNFGTKFLGIDKSRCLLKLCGKISKKEKTY